MSATPCCRHISTVLHVTFTYVFCFRDTTHYPAGDNEFALKYFVHVCRALNWSSWSSTLRATAHIVLTASKCTTEPTTQRHCWARSVDPRCRVTSYPAAITCLFLSHLIFRKPKTTSESIIRFWITVRIKSTKHSLIYRLEELDNYIYIIIQLEPELGPNTHSGIK